MYLLIKNGRVIDPANKLDDICDVLIYKSRIVNISKNISLDYNHKVIDATNLWVTPGWIDLHTHLREPGFEYKENISSGVTAAVAGGFTTICCMPNTNPVIDSPEIVRFIVEKSKQEKLTRVLPVGAITKGQEGERLSQMEEMAEAGVCAFSEDGKSVANTFLMKMALEKAKELGLPIFSHCEDINLVNKGVIDEDCALKFNLPGISKISEEIIIARDILLAESIGAQLHICHLSTAGGLRLIKEAQKRNAKVTAEVCPHHFTLCTNDILEDDGFYKMNPPLRSYLDQQMILQEMKEFITAIATDHAPHSIEEKTKGFAGSAFGIVGLETAVGLCISQLVKKNILTPSQLVEKLTLGPARILGINFGTLSVGSIADITILDPNKEYTVDSQKFFSKGRNTPFNGWRLAGSIYATIIEGSVCFENSNG